VVAAADDDADADANVHGLMTVTADITTMTLTVTISLINESTERCREIESDFLSMKYLHSIVTGRNSITQYHRRAQSQKNQVKFT